MFLFALVLFIALVACWFALPGTAAVETTTETEVLPATVSTTKA